MIDFEVPEEIAGLESELGRFAGSDLRSKMREFEAAGGWDDAALEVFDSFAVPALDLPEKWGGAGAGTFGKMVALEAVARGDAGGLLAADQPGPAAAALLACPDENAAKEIASACLARRTSAALALGGRESIDWIPARGGELFLFVTEGSSLHLSKFDAGKLAPSRLGAFEASAGFRLDLAAGKPVGEWTLAGEEPLSLRGRARLDYAAIAIGIASASLEYAISYAKERIVMGKPVAHHQGNAFSIAEAAGILEAARVSVRTAAHRFDAGTAWAGYWATLSYLDALDATIHVTDLGVQLLGGHGYIEDHPAEKWFREARVLAQLFGGRDAALEDVAEAVFEVPDSLLSLEEKVGAK